MKINIEKRIPLTPVKRLATSSATALREAFTNMRSGDSFIYSNPHKSLSEVYQAAAATDSKCTARKLNNKGKFRVWKQ